MLWTEVAMQATLRPAFISTILLLTVSAFGQSARDYYNEIYKAGGLDRMADEYACFDDDPKLETFFIIGKSETLRQFLIDKGEFKRMTRAQRTDLNRGFLITRGYDQGVAHSHEETYSTDGTSFATEPGIIDGLKLRMRLSIEWTTLRYKRSVEILSPNGKLKSVPVSRYGRCEEVSPDVRQMGNQ